MRFNEVARYGLAITFGSALTFSAFKFFKNDPPVTNIRLELPAPADPVPIKAKESKSVVIPVKPVAVLTKSQTDQVIRLAGQVRTALKQMEGLKADIAAMQRKQGQIAADMQQLEQSIWSEPDPPRKIIKPPIPRRK